MDSTEGPLVSFCVKCYNQERYIGEALEGAFAQTYRPLEIVISDDASTDRSWEIITEAVAKSRHRPDANVDPGGGLDPGYAQDRKDRN